MGGSAREWTTVLDENIVPGSRYVLELAMTKWQDPAVVIGYEVFVR
ncbi:MAG: hypothetical protein R3325_09915 [Thermoanaerobaculia bacterium]|nr:hypothetical protein [Thermoanaerobaculia bacterium]